MVRLLFFGDFVKKNNCANIFSNRVKDIVSLHDIISCNFEAPIINNDSVPIEKKGPNIFQSEDSIKILVDNGFNLFSIANNHIYDYGQKGLEITLNKLKDILYCGAGLDFNSAYELKIKVINNIKIGFLSFCESEFGALIDDKYNRGGYGWVNHHLVNNIILQSKGRVDKLIVQVHAGVEEIEIPLPEWRYRYRELVDLGADTVIAHHPHVPQGWEIYNDKPIFYSLGNFYFDSESEDFDLWNKGYAVSLVLDRDNKITFNVITIKKDNNIIDLAEDDEVYKNYLDYLCNLLERKNYTDKVDDMIFDLWENRYKNRFFQSSQEYRIKANPKDRSIMNRIKCCVKLLIPGYNFFQVGPFTDETFLLHNIRFESHRWVVERYLTMKYEKKLDLINIPKVIF